MIRKIHLTAAVTALALVLGACSSDTEERANVFAVAGAQVLSIAKGERKQTKGRAPYKTLSRKQLENTKIAALQVNNETRGGTDFFKRSVYRNDDYPGTVAVWGEAGTPQLIIRNGVVVGTRGIGGDIISADARGTISAVTGARSGNGERRYFLSDGAYGSKELVMSCDIDNLGRATTQVVHLSYATTHLRETCIGGAQDRVRIVNEYWVQPGSGLVRRSRQWVGPLSGYFELILLRN